MSCGKCSLWACGRTTACPPRTYFRYENGKIVEYFELPKVVAKALSRALEKVIG